MSSRDKAGRCDRKIVFNRYRFDDSISRILSQSCVKVDGYFNLTVFIIIQMQRTIDFDDKYITKVSFILSVKKCIIICDK